MIKYILAGLLVFMSWPVWAFQSGQYTIGTGQTYANLGVFSGAIQSGFTGWCTGYINANYVDTTTFNMTGINMNGYGITIMTAPTCRVSTGTWDTAKFYMNYSAVSQGTAFLIGTGNTNGQININGLQIQVSTATAIKDDTSDAASTITIQNCFLRSVKCNQDFQYGIWMAGSAGVHIYQNNIIANFNDSSDNAGAGINLDVGGSPTLKIYHNTLYKNSWNVRNSAVATFYDNIANLQQTRGNYTGGGTFNGSNNVTDDGTSAGTGSISGTVAFVSTTTYNFSLKSSDTIAYHRGVTISDGLLLDINGTQWYSTPSCGAVEFGAGGGGGGGGGSVVTKYPIRAWICK